MPLSFKDIPVSGLNLTQIKSIVKHIGIGAESLGFDCRAGQLGR